MDAVGMEAVGVEETSQLAPHIVPTWRFLMERLHEIKHLQREEKMRSSRDYQEMMRKQSLNCLEQR